MSALSRPVLTRPVPRRHRSPVPDQASKTRIPNRAGWGFESIFPRKEGCAHPSRQGRDGFAGANLGLQQVVITRGVLVDAEAEPPGRNEDMLHHLALHRLESYPLGNGRETVNFEGNAVGGRFEQPGHDFERGRHRGAMQEVHIDIGPEKSQIGIDGAVGEPLGVVGILDAGGIALAYVLDIPTRFYAEKLFRGKRAPAIVLAYLTFIVVLAAVIGLTRSLADNVLATALEKQVDKVMDKLV